MNTDTKVLITTAGALLAVAAGTAVALSGLGSHWGWWNFRTGFAVIKWAAAFGLLAAAVCAAGLFWALSQDAGTAVRLGGGTADKPDLRRLPRQLGLDGQTRAGDKRHHHRHAGPA